MAASIHVKSKSKWKPVKLDPKIYSDKHFGGLICVEELTDYELVKSCLSPENTKESKPKVTVKKSQPGEVAVLGKQKKKRKAVSVEISTPAKVKKQNTVDAAEASDSVKQKSEKPVSRKKKKLLKWKEKDRLRKEAKREKVVEGQNIVAMMSDDSGIISQCDDGAGSATSKQKHKQKSEAKKSKTDKEKKDVMETTLVPVKITESEDSPEMSAWSDLLVPAPVLRALRDLRFTSPMPIQTLALPSAIRDRMDIVGAARTGSGKTLAFAIPVLYHIMQYKEWKSKQATGEVTDGEEDSGEEMITDESDLEDSGSDNEDTYESEESEDSESDNKAGQEIEMLGLPKECDESGEEYDNPPDEEDFDEAEEEGTGLVKVLNDVEFDWPEKDSQKPQQSNHIGELLCLVLTPTRELAVQVKNHIEAVAKYTDITVGLVVGGMAPQKQKRLLKRCPEIVVATPGRLWELIQEGDSYLRDVEDIKYLVIDEADRMVEKGHFEELSILLERINANEAKKNRRQTFVFSATLTVVHSGPQRMISKKKKVNLTVDMKLDKLMSKIGMKERPKVIDLSGRVGTADTLTEAKIHCATQEKDGYLYFLLTKYPGRTLVFANSKDCIRRLSSVFTLLKRNPLTLHADMHQKQRLKNLERFTGDDKGLLLATDVAARGLDIPNVQHVIHYQVPRTTENYVHRSGRTARAYKEGLSVMLIGPEDLKNYRKIIFTLNKNEDLPMFPVDYQYYNTLLSRVSLACQVDSKEHRIAKQKHQNNWFQKAAKEADLELDEDVLLNDLGDQEQQSTLKANLKAMKDELQYLLKQPVSSYHFSGKYPTKSGKLVLPKQPDTADSAISCVKKDRPLQSKILRTGRKAKPNPKAMHKKKKYGKA